MEGKPKSIKVIIWILIITTLSSLVVIAALLMQPKPNYSIVIEVDVLNEGIKSEQAILIDMRDEADYKAGHIEGAVNIPYTDGGIKLLEYLKKNASKRHKLYLMCYHGNRSGMAFNLLIDEGYTNLNYVRLGYEDYVNAMGSRFKPVQGEYPCKNYD